MVFLFFFVFFKQKTSYEMRISDWSSDVCSSDLLLEGGQALTFAGQVFRLNYDNDPLRNSNRFGGAVSYVVRTFIVSLQGGKEETRRAAGDHLSTAYAGFSFGIEQPVAEGLSLIGGLYGELRRYEDRKSTRLNSSH